MKRLTAVAREEDDGPFDVSPEEDNLLLAAIGQAERGEAVSGKTCASGGAASGRFLPRTQGPSRPLLLVVDIGWRGSGIIEVGRILWQI